MINGRFSLLDATAWVLTVYLLLHVPHIEMRVDDFEQQAQAQAREQPPASTESPVEEKVELNMGKCFHLPRSKCPAEPNCTKVGSMAVFCCDLDSARLKEALASSITQNTTYLHVLNASIDVLDVSQAIFRRLSSMAFTDGNIDKIVGQFPKFSTVACLNISNNNLTTAKLPIQRPYSYLFNLSILDASANNLTEFPLSLLHSNRKVSVDLSGNKYLPCKHFQKAMETNNSSLVTFINYKTTYCALDISFNWFKDVRIVQIDHLRVQKELNASCRNIKPANINCTCIPERLEFPGGEVTNMSVSVSVDCTQRNLTVMPTDLPMNTVKLNVSLNNITSLQPVADDASYEHLRQLIVDHNDIANILELEGTKFIDNFMLFSIAYNKLKTIHTYVLSNRFDTTGPALSIAGNHIHCDCNTEKMLKPWLLENFKNIPDFKMLECEDNNKVVDLLEWKVCHTPRDWTDYIYYIIGLEVLILVLLISKVSYDYWVFKTAGYLPWPANKMPRLPCDWLCE
ncbi:unnamed protein product [Chrysodeixis includens]|uniref:Protein halfway n=1 Tax=Chrysodeixis includens TaxID=689277 RepID=A0A9P0BSH1_CHRIL|nr:unnamed protein product [Chrysodeixis includens]